MKRQLNSLLVVLLLSSGYLSAQSFNQFDIHFEPRAPTSGDILNLNITIYSHTVSDSSFEVQIIKYTDTNKDMKWSGLNEIIRLEPFVVQDNSQDRSIVDKEPVRNKILITIDSLTSKDLPDKYEARVIRNNTRKSTSITTKNNDNSPTYFDFLNLRIGQVLNFSGFSIWESLIDQLDRSYGPYYTYQGNKFYSLNIQNNNLNLIGQVSDNSTLSEPQWSSDESRIVFVLTENMSNKIAISSSEQFDPQIITNGPFDNSPHFLDSNRILYIKDGLLATNTIQGNQHKIIDSTMHVNKILHVNISPFGYYQVTLDKTSEYVEDSNDIVLTTLNKEFSITETTLLRDHPVLYYLNYVSEHGILDSNSNGLFLHKLENDIDMLIDNNINDMFTLDAIWSPSHKNILIISN